MAKSFAILLPYFNRLEQFRLSLQSLQGLYDWEVKVYVAWDEKFNSWTVDQLGNEFGFEVVETNRTHQYRNPGVLFNLLASIAQEDYLVLSNPEIYHLKPVLLDAMENAEVGQYRVYGCKNLSGLCLPGYSEEDLTDKVMPWYQHSEFRPALLHFCSVISREDFWSLSGFDPGYDAGYAYEDSDFVCKVKASGMKIVQVDDPYVGHQAHERPPQSDPLLIAKIVRNRWLYLTKWGNSGI